MTLFDYALQYLQRGWKPVPIPAGQKGPRIKEWQKLRLTETDAVKCFSGVGNIGILLGEASGGLIDIDLDCSEALKFAPTLLQPTRSIFGRISKPQSHRLYRISGLAPSLQFKDPLRGDNLLELRGDGGRQTVFPPSIHPSGESIAFSADGDPQQVDYVNVDKASKAARSAVPHWPISTSSDERYRIVEGVN